MKNKNIILPFLTLLASFSFFIFPVSAINNPDYIEIIGPGDEDEIYFLFDLKENNVLKIEFEVTAGGNKDVDFYILNSVNFVKWNNSESFSYIVFRNRVVYANINFVVPYNDTFYVIFSNSFSIITSKTVEIDFTLTDSNDRGDKPSFPLEISLIIIISVAIIIVLGSLIIRYNKKRIPNGELISEKQESIAEAQNNRKSEKDFCPLCGELIFDNEGEYCSKCGGALK